MFGPTFTKTLLRDIDDAALIEAIVAADHHDPFGYLGMHETDAGLVMRALLPQAKDVWLVDGRSGEVVAPFLRLHPAGLFAAELRKGLNRFPHRLRLKTARTTQDVDDAYRFPPSLGDLEQHLISEGTHFNLYRKLGAHQAVIDAVAGVAFAVWAPNARRVSVVGPFNEWDGRRHVMRCHYDCGVWEIFVPGIEADALYKFEIKRPDGTICLKADPMARRTERRPATASVVTAPGRSPCAGDWATQRAQKNARGAPMSIFEVHPGSWCRRSQEGGRFLTYHELADELVPYAQEMGFTHLELMPIVEHPFDGSWGYQPLSLFAPTARHGSPDAFHHLISRCHEAGLGVLLDWVPAHFPDDPHGLASFDGTHLYEHADPRIGRRKDWDSLIYNLGRREVALALPSRTTIEPIPEPAGG
ncbi:MAG: GlgB N-terminal domain-containing protein [Methylovirgula sp.]